MIENCIRRNTIVNQRLIAMFFTVFLMKVLILNAQKGMVNANINGIVHTFCYTLNYV